ncbi:sensor histidine kinase [Actinoplanes sp. NPDC026619]|uniref:sensor histidine kinase n=1 Tax=Actinoplanes sp. NPDC026619 TaxID=3155798 RepID=UPI0033DF3790
MRTFLRPVLADVLLATLLTALTVATVAGQPGSAWPWAVLLAVLSVAPVALRQLGPVLTMLTIIAAIAAASLFGYGDLPSGGVGLLVAMFSVATLRSRRMAALMFVSTVALLALVYLTMRDELVWSQIAQAALIIAGAWLLGESTRRWARRTELVAARAARAVADERVRIARELHDILAHHMSVISLQAGLAEYVLDADQATARKAIGTVADTSREAMLELRRLLDVLRVDRDDEPDLRPQPGLAMLDEMIVRTRAAGPAVTVVVSGPARPLPPGPDLCAYRMVQESLTNVLKHAGPAGAQVALDYGPHTLTIRVTDDGPPVRAYTESHGIRGMRERAELYGGVLTAGPRASGGFAVSLRLPLEEQ